MQETPDWLPGLVLLQDYSGMWNRYVEALYDFFHDDFILTRPLLAGVTVNHKKYPMEKGKEATFWHLISSGLTEEEREPDIRRCERIRWAKVMIEAVDTDKVRYWKTRRSSKKRRNELRHLIALPDFSYLVVLADRGTHILLWTAFCVEKEHRRKKLEKEWKRYRKS